MLTVPECEKSNNDGICYGVTVQKGENGENRAIRHSDEPETAAHDDHESAIDTSDGETAQFNGAEPAEFGIVPKRPRAQVEQPIAPDDLTIPDDLSIPFGLRRRPQPDEPRKDGKWADSYLSDDDDAFIASGKFK